MWRELSVRLIFLNVSKEPIYVAACFCLVVLLIVLWRMDAFRKRWIALSCALLTSGVVAGIIAQAVWAKGRADFLLRTAQERINSFRKAPVQITVLDSEGKPLAGATVRVEQRRHSFLFGCNAFRFYFHPDAHNETYAARFSALFNYATLPFYWGMYEPQKGDVTFYAQMHKELAAWFEANHIETKGHPLVWHDVYPAWAPSDADAARDAVQQRIARIIPEFKAEIRRWDVVNEATVARSFDTGIGHWVRRDGPARLVETALRWAHAAGPSAQLIYNDFNVGPQHRRLIAQLVQADAPFQIIGIQSHMHHREWPLAEAWNICEDYSKFGKAIHFSEVTVLSGKHGWELPAPWPTTPQGEQTQAEYVERLYTLLFSHPAVQAITWWDLQDGEWMGAPGGLLHADLTPKPAYDRLMKLIHEIWWTRESLLSDEMGVCELTGFLGEYEVKVQREALSRTVGKTLIKGTNNWTVTLK